MLPRGSVWLKQDGYGRHHNCIEINGGGGNDGDSNKNNCNNDDGNDCKM